MKSKSNKHSILEIKDWPHFFQTIRSRPPMYLGNASITALFHFIDGFKYSEQIHKVNSNKRFNGFSFEKFEEWVDSEFNKRKLAVRSFHLAKIKAKSEEKAFTLWFQWYDTYMAKSQKSKLKTINPIRNYP